MILRNAQHVADHDHRQAVREVLDHVHRALVGDAVELLVDQLADARPHVGDAAGGEGLGDQAAQAGVVRRIEHQHRAREVGDHRLVHAIGAVAAV